jgi:AAA+ ATPase superfamily predicted ATPase
LEKETGSNLVMEDILWTEGRIPGAELFKGREAVIDMLCDHYCSREREKPYILYGLTRTGKSSILSYLKKEIDGKVTLLRGPRRKIITIDWDLSTAANYGKASEFWEYIVYEQSYNKLQPEIKTAINSIYNF